jgi:Delta7-sterol 5-desaturase
MSKEEWERQTKEMERMVVEVEGEDDRSYGPPERLAKQARMSKMSKKLQ